MVRVPGTGHSGRDVLITHYDSAPAAPGAGDDGVQVVAMLEALRELRAGNAMRNDLALIFTDGEEDAGSRGGHGIQAFMADPSLSSRIAVAFAFECRPESSRTTIRADHAFFTMPGLGLVHYPTWVMRAVAVGAALACAAPLVAARSRRGIRLVRAAVAGLAIVGTCAAVTVPAWAAWQLPLKLNPESQDTIHYPDFEKSGAAMTVILGLALLCYVVAAYWLSPRAGVLEYIAGGAMLLALGVFSSPSPTPCSAPSPSGWRSALSHPSAWLCSSMSGGGAWRPCSPWS
jgi:hypothetical protein